MWVDEFCANDFRTLDIRSQAWDNVFTIFVCLTAGKEGI